MHRTTLLACLALAACNESPPREPADAGAVRQAGRAYVDALRAQDWASACRRMTGAARSALRAEAGGSCERALAEGGALAPGQLDAIRRQLDGATVQVRGERATLGPLGDAERPLALERRGGSWLVAG